MQLTGSQRCAVFLLAMGEDVATDMLGRMQRQEVARITEAMASLPHVPESEVRAILREARIFLETQADGICADRALAGRLLAHCLGEREARETMRAWGPAESARPFESLERMRPGQLYQLLRQEHPQTLALVLGHLSASQAAGLLMRLPAEMRSLLLEHIGGLAPVDADILDEVDSVLARQAAERSVQDWRPGLQVAAEIVAAAGKDAARELLADLERHDSRLPSLLGRMVHCPEDCLKLEDGLLEEALEETSVKLWSGSWTPAGLPCVRPCWSMSRRHGDPPSSGVSARGRHLRGSLRHIVKIFCAVCVICRQNACRRIWMRQKPPDRGPDHEKQPGRSSSGLFFLDVQATYLSRIRALASQLRSLASRPFSCR